MKKISLSYLSILFAIAVLTFPSVTMAAWYNPFSWFKKINDNDGSLNIKAPQLNNSLILNQGLIFTDKKLTSFGDLLNNLQDKKLIKIEDFDKNIGIANSNQSSVINSSNKSQTSAAPQLKQLNNSQVIKKVKPAVVYIETNDGAGSGMIISSDGNVLTNAHVVEGLTNVSVSLSTGEKLSGAVLGRDEAVDLAVIKINSTRQFSKVDFGDSDKTEQGDEVFTFGFPFGIEGDVSFKEGTISRRIENYFETSAEIHPGNSGGPLVNRYGQVIGINTAILGKSVQGIQLGETIKLAIPINNAKGLIAELKAGRNIVVPTEPVQPQRQTYPIISQEDISTLSPGLQAVATASYSEFRQIPDLQYLTPQQQYELLKRIVDRRMADYEAQLRQRLEQLNRINQIVNPEPAPPPSPKIPFDFDVQVSVESSGPTGGSRIVRFSIISEPFYVCTSLIKGRYDLAIDTKEIRSGNTIESGYLDNGVYKYEIGCIGGGDKYDNNMTKKSGSFTVTR